MDEQFTFFWRTKSPFSQWHPSRYRIAGVEFNCAEQYMMFKKAEYFNDIDIMKMIMKATNPNMQKRLGRSVKNFDASHWEHICQQIVYDANYAKFNQNAHLKRTLLATRGTTLVEASPVDPIWGIGLAEDDPRALNRDTWLGQNLLGEILTRIRDGIKE
jgi:ribA/ribD-fused uncharacterized protein